jgi:hypothetical protein
LQKGNVVLILALTKIKNMKKIAFLFAFFTMTSVAIANAQSADKVSQQNPEKKEKTCDKKSEKSCCSKKEASTTSKSCNKDGDKTEMKACCKKGHEESEKK